MSEVADILYRARTRIHSDWDSERGWPTASGRFSLLRALWGDETHHEGHRETCYVDTLARINEAAGILDSQYYDNPGHETDVSDSERSHECHVDSESDCLEARIEQRLICWNEIASRQEVIRLLAYAYDLEVNPEWQK